MRQAWKIALVGALCLAIGLVAGFAGRDLYYGRTGGVHSDTTGHVERPCPSDAFVVVVFGQSNSANMIGARHEPPSNMLSHYAGKCWGGHDPLLGAEGGQGNIAVPLARRLNVDEPVVVEAMGIGSSAVDDWLSGSLRAFYDERVADLKSDYPRVDLVVWLQGERDKRTEPAEFRADLEAWMRQIKRDFPGAVIGITGTSYCGGESSGAVVAAQRATAQRLDLIFLGETDAFRSREDRYDDCHLSAVGAEKVAEMMAQAVQPALAAVSQANPASGLQ